MFSTRKQLVFLYTSLFLCCLVDLLPRYTFCFDRKTDNVKIKPSSPSANNFTVQIVFFNCLIRIHTSNGPFRKGPLAHLWIGYWLSRLRAQTTFWKLFGASNGLRWMCCGPERSSLNAGVKSSRQTLDCMAERLQSSPVNHWLKAPVRRSYSSQKCFVML